MKPTIERPGRRIGDAEIDRLEQQLALRLPPSYRRFLLTFNGGSPVPGTVEIPGHPGSPTDVQVFFGIDRPVASSGIEWNCEVFRGRLRGRYLPIARGSLGNVFCLTCGGPRDGAVDYYDMQSVVGDYAAIPKAYAVAASFDDLLQSLRAT